MRVQLLIEELQSAKSKVSPVLKMKRRVLYFILTVFIQVFCILMITQGAAAGDYYGSMTGLQVPGSEGCTDMNSGYTFAIRSLIDSYGLAQYNLEENIFSDWPEQNGVCWAGLLSKNPELSPYLAVTRFDYDSQEEFYQYYIYVYSWEDGKLILQNWFPSQEYWVADLDGTIVFVSVFDDGYDIISLDNSTPDQYYMPDYETYDDEEDEYGMQYQVGENIGDYYDYLEAEFNLKVSRIDLPGLRYCISPEGKLYGISSAVEDIYCQVSGEPVLVGNTSQQYQWKVLYQQIIELTGENPGIRYSLVYLDDDRIPELVIRDYSLTVLGIVSSDGAQVYSIASVDNTALEAADRLGSILLMSTTGLEDSEGTIASVIDISGGRFSLKERGGYLLSEGLYVWSGIPLGSGKEGEASFQSKLNQAIQISVLVFLWPKYDSETVLRLLNVLETGVVLTVTDSWTEEETLSFTAQFDTDRASGTDSYEDTVNVVYDDEEDYEEETPYTGPADLADAKSDWNAVNEAGLTSGDPVTVPGDFYTDTQDRYKDTGYILPQSATQYLTEEDIAHLTMKGCCYARNEIYARHGRLFNAAELVNYFNARSWYDGTVSPDDFNESYTQSVFNEYEYANAYFLLKYEEEHGMYWPE